LGSSAAPCRGSTHLPHVRRAHPQLCLINNAYACTRLPDLTKTEPLLTWHSPSVCTRTSCAINEPFPPGLCANDATNMLTVICLHSAMAPSPAIVRLALSVDLSGRIMSTLCVRDHRSIAAHQGISRQQMGDASINRTTAAMPGLIPGTCTWAQSTGDQER
jgi:hypothetical protein